MAKQPKFRTQTDLAEAVGKHADLSVNVVLRVFYALKEISHDVDVAPLLLAQTEPKLVIADEELTTPGDSKSTSSKGSVTPPLKKELAKS